MSTSADSGNRTRVLIAAAVAVGGLGVALWALSSQLNGGGGGGGNGTSSAVGGAYKKNMKAGALKFSAEADPHLATQCVVNAIRGGAIKSVGGLVYVTRGPAEVVPEGQKLKNAYRICAPAGFIQFLKESYLPATLPTGEDAATPSSVPLERAMLSQLVVCDTTLRRLERERATPFDNDNRAHTNLLQQLWVAVGRPLSSYARTGKGWMDLGFQSEDPTTDIRGSGMLGLRQLVHFAQHQPQAMRDMMAFNKRVQDDGADCWYLVAVVSFQFTAQLMLQKDHPFYLHHLQVLYDTVVPAGSTAATTTGTTASASPAGAKAVSREAHVADLMEKQHLAIRDAANKAWTDGEYASDAEAGLFLLHEKLMLHFKAAWEADRPHVMSYNTYVAEKVFGKFFTSSWSP